MTEPGKVRTLHIGKKRVGIFEDEVFTIAQWCEPTPLPFAPASVRGIVAIESRMFTVLDLDVGPTAQRAEIVALRGDEQLALAVDSSEITQDDAEQIQLLDLSKLFSTVMKGQERRRRNS